MPRHHFAAVEHAVAGEKIDVLFQNKRGKRIGGGGEVCKAASFGLLEPASLISVAVKENPAVLAQRVADQGVERRLKILGLFQNVCVFAERFCHDRVEDDVGPGNRLARAQHTELKLVAREGQRRGAVAVGRVLRNRGQNVHADAKRAFFAVGVVGLADDGVNDVAQLVSQIDGNDGGRRFLCAEAMVVSGERDCRAKKLLIFVHALNKGREEQQKLRVLAGRFAGGKEVFAGVGG